MSGLCKDCKWWVFPPPDGYGDPPVGNDEFGICELTRRDLGDMFYPQTKAIPADDDGNWNHVLSTAPDFGCNQFEAKT